MYSEDDFKSMLKRKDLKVTRQRVAVLKVLAECPGLHLASEQIYEKVKLALPEIGLATVYRTIQLLLELGLIDKINLDDGIVRYEISDNKDADGKHRHHHLICMGCGDVFAFEDDMLDKLEQEINAKKDFMVVNHEVKFYGYCRKCRNMNVKN